MSPTRIPTLFGYLLFIWVLFVCTTFLQSEVSGACVLWVMWVLIAPFVMGILDVLHYTGRICSEEVADYGGVGLVPCSG